MGTIVDGIVEVGAEGINPPSKALRFAYHSRMKEKNMHFFSEKKHISLISGKLVE